MTDLERNWDDLPVGPAPLDAILREGRRAAAADRRRRPEARLKRSLAGVAVIGGIAAAFVAGTLVTAPEAGTPAAVPPGSAPLGGGSGGSSDVVPAAFHGELEPAASCEDLLGHYVDAGVDLVSAYGWSSPYYDRGYGFDDGLSPIPAIPSLAQAANVGDVPDLGTNARAPRNFVAATSTSESSDTGTNVQEAGVDEPDSVKTNGEVLVRLKEHTLTTYDVTGAEVADLGSLDLGDFHDGEILLSGDRVVAIGTDGTRPDRSLGYYDPGYNTVPQTRVVTIDISDPAAPSVVQTLDYTAATVTARQHGDAIRLILSAGLPDLDFVQPGRGRRSKGSQKAALEANKQAVLDSTLDDWLPRVSIDGAAPTQFLDCDRVAIPRAELALATMAVVGFSASTTIADPADLSTLGLAGSAPLAYESADHLYLAASPTNVFNGCFDCFFPTADNSGEGTGTTHVYDFSLNGASATYLGAGDVEGSIRDRWAMDEYDGVLRLAVSPSSETGNFNSIVTMRLDGRADGDELKEIGRLDKIGTNEDIKSVRWFDGLALVVTFRQVDPFFAIDLTDQSNPTLMGELKIPGFSSYLHPLGGMRVVGIGEGPQTDGRGSGAQAGLFDVTDLTEPARLDVVSYGAGTRELAGGDPRQFTWVPSKRMVLTVIVKGRTGYVSAMHVLGGKLTNTMTQVEYGSDVDEVRTVPVSADRVVLVTGEDVSFFDLGR